MKNFFSKKIFNKKTRLDIYFYIISIFSVIQILLFIFFINQSHKIINNIKIIETDYEVINQYIAKKNEENILKNYLYEKWFSWSKFISWFDINLNSFFDFETDNSIEKFVSAEKSFDYLKYEPDDLVLLSWDYLINSKWNSMIRKEVLENLQKMSEDFYTIFQTKINVISAYRSYNYQLWIKSRWCSDLFCAKAWFSEHQTGLAVDLWEASNEKSFLSNSNYAKYFEWLKENAYKYGFHNTYQKWVEIDTYVVEPWHWRYLWKSLAKLLWENNITIAEYYNMFN